MKEEQCYKFKQFQAPNDSAGGSTVLWKNGEVDATYIIYRSEEHTSELQSH